MRSYRSWCSRSVQILAAILLAAIFAAPGSAQTFRGTILGTVTDSSGAAVAGATVTIKNVDTGVIRSTTSNVSGEFNMPELPIGTYTVTIEQNGFQSSVTTGIVVQVAATARVDVSLKPGEMKQQVVVSGESISQVETTNDTLGGTLTQDNVKDLPVNGRDYTKLIYLTPGIAGSPDQITDSPGSFGVFSLNGARGRSNNFLLDGTDMNDGYRNDPVINEAGVFGTPATILPIDAISELRVLSNYEPEYGRNSGAVINIVTRSGSNQFHGNALEYFRNDGLDARNFFNDVGNTKAPFHNSQFGGSLGGPIIKDRTFFFGDYEGQRERVGVVSLACVPDPTEIAALGGATNSVIAALLARNPWPAPNIPGAASNDTGCSTPNASVVAPSYNNVDSFIIKIDHNFNENNLLTGRYYFGNSKQVFPLALTGGGILPGFGTYTPTRVQLVSISYVTVLTPTKVNELRFGWNRFGEGFFPQDTNFQPSTIGLIDGTGVADKGLPVIDVGGFSQIGASSSDPRMRVDQNWQALDNFSWKVGKHDIKFGYEFRRTTIQQFLGTNFRGELDFNDLEDFLSGTIDGGGQSTGNANRNTYQNSNGLYVQDSFHILPRVTVNYGLRWDYFGVVKETNNLFSNITSFDPAAQTFTLTQVGSPGLGSLYNPDHKDFAPRLSVAWDVFGTGRTVVRSGFGLFFDQFSQDIFLGHLPYNTLFDPGPAYNPFGPDPIFSVGTQASIVSGLPVYEPAGATPSGDVFSVTRHFPTPYMENYNLNIQQQLSKKTVLQVGYVGSQGHRLTRFRDIDQPGLGLITSTDLAFAAANVYSFPNPVNPLAPPIMGPCVTAGVPTGGPGCIPAYNTASRVYANNPYGAFAVNQEETSAKSNYNALQTSLRVNGWHGVTSIVNYVWSHSLDTASDSEDFIPNAAQPNDSTNPQLEYADSNFDIRNRFTWIFAYQLPNMGGSWQRLKNGWGFDSTVTLQDGQPFALNYDFEGDYSGSGEGDDRPDVVGPIQYNSSNPNEFLNLTSFAIPCTPTAFALGTVSPTPGIQGDEQDCVPGTRHFGDEGRNALRGPTFKQWDFAVFKDTAITERLKVQLRVELFNILNHPNFSNPELPDFIADAAQNGFQIANGREVSAGDYAIKATGDVGIGNPFLGGGGPRGIQLAAKFTF
jgi:Carboxypeptidase regulatory-like domain/TonB dependent receptor